MNQALGKGHCNCATFDRPVLRTFKLHRVTMSILINLPCHLVATAAQKKHCHLHQTQVPYMQATDSDRQHSSYIPYHLVAIVTHCVCDSTDTTDTTILFLMPSPPMCLSPQAAVAKIFHLRKAGQRAVLLYIPFL